MEFLGLALLIVAGFLAIFFYLWRRLEAPKDNQSALALLQQQVSNLQGVFAQLIKEVATELTKVGETTKQVGNVAEQIKGLQDILKNPKQRGILGEYYLEAVLKNIFPPSQYQLQYAFADGTVVDAAIFVKDRIIPIDSKFSLENYQRGADKSFYQDLKNRIEETAKYIKPEQGTMDFAFMFIPAEAIYYDLLVNRDLIEYAWNKRVIVVSPTSFYAYLQTILQGMRALQIEESAKGIVKRVGELSRHLAAYEDYMRRLGIQLGTTVNSYNTAYKELGKIDKDVLRITGQAAGIEPTALDRPKGEEETFLES